jgi:hypothetical protein
MSVRPLAFQGGILTVWHEDEGHGGDIPLANLRFEYDLPAGAPVTDTGTSFNLREAPLSCPVCGAVSVHPITGGAARRVVQLLFAALFIRRAGGDLPGAKAALQEALGDDAGAWSLTDDELAQVAQALSPYAGAMPGTA